MNNTKLIPFLIMFWLIWAIVMASVTMSSDYMVDNGCLEDYQSPAQAPWDIQAAAEPGTWRVFNWVPSDSHLVVKLDKDIVYDGQFRVRRYAGWDPLFLSGDYNRRGSKLVVTVDGVTQLVRGNRC